MTSPAQRLLARLDAAGQRIPAHPHVVVEGRLRKVVGLTIEAVGCRVGIGGRCSITAADGREVEAEVVGFGGDSTYLMPVSHPLGLLPDAPVISRRHISGARIGEDWLGRVLDGEGMPLDGGERPRGERYMPLMPAPLNPLQRNPINEPLDVGVRAVNALLSLGRGQRIGLFAGPGVGKSTLLGMMTRYTAADVIVVGLIGERGREVRDFVQDTLGPEAMSRACVIATPSDCSPLMRLNGAWLSSAVAEYFRDRGQQVLLLMDSLTRFAQAGREVGLAIGEPPTTRGFPPSVFARIPQLVERAGQGGPGQGSITGIYTVLTEGEDGHDPVSETARSVLDGHLVLSRSIAEAGIYPAIDIEASLSRLANVVTTAEQRQCVAQVRSLISAYQRSYDLIRIGAYQKGSDPVLDKAVNAWPALQKFVSQEFGDSANFADSLSALSQLMREVNPS